MEPEMKRDPDQETIKTNFGPSELIWLTLGGLAMTGYPFTRLLVGKRGWGRIGPACIVVLLIWMTCPCPEVVPFFLIWFPAVLLQRLVTLFGPRQIARYEGDFWPRLFIPFLGEQAAKLLAEPALVYVVGLWISWDSPRFGQLFQLSAGAMFLRQAFMMWVTRAQDDAARDIEEEMRQRVARMRR
jgi:hypothetical protein